MKQTTFADSGFEITTKKTRKRIFLEETNAVVPWVSLVGIAMMELCDNFRYPSFFRRNGQELCEIRIPLVA